MSCTPAAYRIGCLGSDATSTTLGILPKQPDDSMLHLQPVSIALTTTSASSNKPWTDHWQQQPFTPKTGSCIGTLVDAGDAGETLAGLVYNVELAQTVCGEVRLVSHAPDVCSIHARHIGRTQRDTWTVCQVK